IAAACVAGVLSLEDAARVVVLRSRAIAGGLAGRGGMVSVGLPVGEVRLGVGVELAAVNGPSSVVVAGDPVALDRLVAEYEAQGVRVRRVPVDYASHTSQVELIEAELAEVLAGLKPRSATVPMYSSVDGRWVEGAELDGGYWFRNLRQTVRFADATTALAAEGFRAFVEVSSHPVLAHSIQETLDEKLEAPSVVTGTLRRDDGDLDRLLLSAAELYVRGIPVDWTPALGEPRSPRVELPTYAFQHQHYWLESTQGARHTVTGDIVPSAPSVPVTDDEIPGSALAHKLAELSQDEQEQLLLDLVRAEAATVLGHETPESVESGSVFFEVGFISLTAVQFRNRLADVTGLELPAMLIFDHPTPTELARHLHALLNEKS
ncbi:acyltransferase domain-containing protein, partial [Streptomyces sp. NPDC001876]|uniref:acyltransferase domain-containing protein n=1 Tax=Streptomyces sp. NPDC001876 TaxID=3154402 RepID=UPI00332EC1EC